MIAKIFFLVFVILALLVGPLPAEAQQAEKVYRIGYMGNRVHLPSVKV